MCNPHTYDRGRTGQRLVAYSCTACGHVLLEDRFPRLHRALSEIDLQIADSWLKALVGGQAGLVNG